METFSQEPWMKTDPDEDQPDLPEVPKDSSPVGRPAPEYPQQSMNHH